MRGRGASIRAYKRKKYRGSPVRYCYFNSVFYDILLSGSLTGDLFLIKVNQVEYD